MNAKRLLNVFMVQARRVYPHHEFAKRSNVCTLRVRLVNALCYLEEKASGAHEAKMARLAASYGVAPAIFAEIMAHYRPGMEARISADLAAARAGYGEQIINGYKAEAEKERLHTGSGQYDPEFWGMSHCGQDAKEE